MQIIAHVTSPETVMLLATFVFGFLAGAAVMLYAKTNFLR